MGGGPDDLSCYLDDLHRSLETASRPAGITQANTLRDVINAFASQLFNRHRQPNDLDNFKARALTLAVETMDKKLGGEQSSKDPGPGMAVTTSLPNSSSAPSSGRSTTHTPQASPALAFLLSAGVMASTANAASLTEPSVDMAELNTVEDGGDELTEADADFLESDDVSASKPSKPHHLLAMRGTIVPSLRIAAGRTSFAASPLARVVVR